MRRVAAAIGLSVLLVACASQQAVTPIGQHKLQAKAYTELYVSLYQAVQQVANDPHVPAKVKRTVRKKVYPAMDALKETIRAYVAAVKDAEAGDADSLWQAALYKVRIEKLLNYLLPLVNDLRRG